jgi:hypothetical protein
MSVSDNELITLACTRRYDVLRIRLDKRKDVSDINDQLARIAVFGQCTDLLSITNHHPRQVLSDFAQDETGFRFLLNFYVTNKVFKSSVPNYIWTAVTLENAKLLVAKGFEIPEEYTIAECSEDVAKYIRAAQNK